MPSNLNERPFHSRKLGPSRVKTLQEFADKFEALAVQMDQLGGPSREKSLALTALEDAAMWFNKHLSFRIPEES